VLKADFLWREKRQPSFAFTYDYHRQECHASAFCISHPTTSSPAFVATFVATFVAPFDFRFQSGVESFPSIPKKNI
jgi:hypothetical protein